MPYMDGLGNVTWEGREIDASFQICFGPTFLDIFDCRDVPRIPRSRCGAVRGFFGREGCCM